MQSESIRVLIVEDGSRDDGELGAILASAGFATRVASEGESALGMLVSWQPAVAVIDLRYPSREARRFCAAVAARPEASPPLVLVAEGPNLLKPTAIIPSGLVAAPIDGDHLVATVRRVVRVAQDVPGNPVLAR